MIRRPVVVITGGAGALGRAHGRAYAAAGYAVVLSDIADPAAAVDEIRAAGGTAVGQVGSVDCRAGGRDIVEAALSAYGRIDVLVNNAGILRDKSFAKITEDMVSDVVAVHLHGAFHVTAAAWEHLGPAGSVIMTSSGTGLYGNVGQANYAAAKMGLVGLTRTLALEGARRGIRVNAIAPVAASPLTEQFLDPALQERLSPEFVSPLLVWLASDRCRSTGHIYSVGGGRYARVAVIEGRGVLFDTVPTPEDLGRRWEELESMDDPTEPGSLADQLALLLRR